MGESLSGLVRAMVAMCTVRSTASHHRRLDTLAVFQSVSARRYLSEREQATLMRRDIQNTPIYDNITVLDEYSPQQFVNQSHKVMGQSQTVTCCHA